jgi:microcystin-dependent protein
MTTFALPNVQGSVAVGIGTLERDLFSLGKTGGKTSVALTEKNLPLHTHTVGFSYKILAKDSEATQGSAKGHYPAYFEQYGYPYHKTANCKTTAFSYTATVQPSGSKEVEKISLLQPYVCLHYIICLEGLYPSRSIKQPEETPMHAIHESNNEQRKEE